MEGDLNQSHHHGFLPDDMAFDDLINQGGWPASAPSNPYPSYQQQTHAPPQNTYSQYQAPSQPAYQYDLPGQSYSPLPYSNSPYASQPQYQPTSQTPQEYHSSYNTVDPSLHASNPYQAPNNSYLFPQQPSSHPTISPNSLYANPSSQLHQVNRATSNSPFQPQPSTPVSSFNHANQHNTGSYFNSFQYENVPVNQPPSTVQYPKLPLATPIENAQPSRNFDSVVVKTNPQLSQAVQPPQPLQVAAIPPSSTVRITHPDLLALKDTTLKHPMNHAPFAVFMKVSGNVLKATDGRVTKTKKPKVGTDGKSSLTKPPIKRARPRKDQSATTTGYKGTGRPPNLKSLKVPGEDGSKTKSASPSDTSSSEESSSEDESEYEEEPAMPIADVSTVREAIRPADPALAARWDAIGIIWKDPNQNPNKEVVSEAVSKYGQFVMAFRNQIKTVMTKIEEAATKPTELPKLKSEQTGLLDALYQTIHAAVQLGAPVIVSQLGNHHQLVNALISTLRDCIKTSDYNGKLPKQTLELLAKFRTLTDDILKKCKFDSVQKRWVKKGDKDTNQKFVEILANTVEAQEKIVKAKELEGDKKAREAFEQAKQRNAEVTKATSSATKRPFEGDASNGKPTKKFASDASGNLGPSTKTTIVKKPTTNLLGIATRPVAKPVVKKREPSPPQESKLGALLASIAKPAEVPKAPAAPPRAPETPEEKARRERKESRRHLRVKFKEGPELEQVRLFKHDQEEDEGRQDDMLRDAADTHNEGMMHKKRATEVMDLDDDDYQPPDVEEPVFTEPKHVDFSLLEKATRYGPTFKTRGGESQVSTPEQKTQERREAVELLVIYTDPNDIPSSAKEPHQLDATATVLPIDLKRPSTPWLSQRLQELDYYGPEQAFRIFASRIAAETPVDLAQRTAQAPHVGSSTDPLTSQSQKPFAMADTSRNGPFKALFDAVDSLNGKPFPATEPPEWMTSLEARAVWMDGYNRDKALLERRQAEAQLAAQIQAQQALPQMQAQPVVPPLPVFDHSLMASIPPQFQPPPLSNSNASPPFQSYGNTPPQSFDYNAWTTANPATNNQNTGLDQIHPSRREEVERPRREDEGRFQSKPKKKSKNWDNFDSKGEYKGPKQPCKFYAMNQCRKGSDCTYSHE